jgi:hypothetical protein
LSRSYPDQVPGQVPIRDAGGFVLSGKGAPTPRPGAHFPESAPGRGNCTGEAATASWAEELETLLGAPDLISLSSEEAKPRNGFVWARAETRHAVRIIDGRTGRTRCYVVPPPAGDPDTSWASNLHREATALSAAYRRPVAGSRAEAERIANRAVYGDTGEVPLTEQQAAGEIDRIIHDNGGLQSLGGG